MIGIAEQVPVLLRSIVEQVAAGRATRLDPEWVSRMERWLEAGELPSLPDLAELLEELGSGFYRLEWHHAVRRGRVRNVDGPPIPVSPRLVVSRLDIGLRALRVERRLTQKQVTAAAEVPATALSLWEREESGKKPSMEQLDRVLRALRASYESLEQAVRNPLRIVRPLERRLEQEEPLILDGEVLPEVVSQRFDLVVRVLRSRRGWQIKELAKRSGLKATRITALERRGAGKVPSEEEIKALVKAFGVDRRELHEVARDPLGELTKLEDQCRRLEGELEGKARILVQGRELPEVTSERFDLALRVLRARRGWSQRELAEASGLEHGRISVLETRGRGSVASEEEVTALLKALEASVGQLLEAAGNPLGEVARLGRKWERLERQLVGHGPTSIGGRRLPPVVSARFDLVLKALRARMGWSRSKLAAEAKLELERVTALETWGNGTPASEVEVKKLLSALGAKAEDLVKVARWPLRDLSRMGSRLGELKAQVERRDEALEEARQRVAALEAEVDVKEGPMYEAACRVALAAEQVRRSLGEAS